MVDGVGTTSWTYNNLSQLTQMNSPQGNVGYGYDSIGQMTHLKNLQASGSLDTVYGIQASTGRLTSVTSAWNEETTFGYDNQGRLITKVLPNGLREEMTYDAANRLESVRVRNHATNALVREETYSYNNRSLVTSHQVNGVTTTYTYDNLGLLLSETRPGYSASYVYDPNGNRTSRTRTIGAGPTEVDVYAYDQGDKLLHIDRTIQHPSAPVTNRFRTYGYNGLGETTSIVENGVTTTFNWNNDGRVTGMDLPGTTNDPTFRYNGFGTRIDRTVGANTEVWKRAGAGVTASVLNDGVANFTPGISSRVGSSSTFTHAGLKNTGAQSEGLAITGTKTYDAFGLETNTTGTWKTAFGYAGNFGYQQTDAGLKLLGHRYYDPETGRFLSRDPIKDGRNWYSYGAGVSSPVAGADASGLALIAIVAAAVLIYDIYDTVSTVAADPSDPSNWGWAIAGMIDPTPGNLGKKGARLAAEAAQKVDMPSGSGPGSGGGGGLEPYAEPGTKIRMILLKGDKIDRLGEPRPDSDFAGPPGQSEASLALPPPHGRKRIFLEVAADYLEVEQSIVAPANGLPGGGTQYKTDNPLLDLINSGVLRYR